MVPVDVQSEAYEYNGISIPAISASASVDGEGKLNLTLSNANPHKDVTLKAYVRGFAGSQVKGRVLQGSVMNAHNTFDQPNAVAPKAFDQAKLNADGLEITVPKMSVVAVQVQ